MRDPNGGPVPIARYPRFTRDEWRKMSRQLLHGKFPDPRKMGSHWNYDGPEVRSRSLSYTFVRLLILSQRFQQHHDRFWQDAHRLGENYREVLPGWPPNPFLYMHQRRPHDLDRWVDEEWTP